MRKVQSYGWLLLLAVCSPWAQAQSYPAKPIRLYTGATGGGPDFIARVVAGEVGAALGQPIVVENRSGNLGVTAVAKAAPDGYTLGVAGGSTWVQPLLEPQPYDVLRDLAPISILTRSPYILVVTSSLPAKSVQELVKLAKSRPGTLNMSSSVGGGGTRIAGDLFRSLAGLDIVRIAYKGGSQESADLVAGQVHLTFGSGPGVSPLVKAGKLRALATTGARRSSLFPELPTVGEAVPGYVAEALLTFWAPAKTPDAIVGRLNQETVRALAKPEVSTKLLNTGQEPAGSTPEQLAEVVRSEITRVTKLIKDLDIKAEN